MSAHDALKAQTLSRSTDGQTKTDRERDCLVLVLNHLQNEGFVQTAACLMQEARVGLSDYEVSDNISLLKVLKEYAEMHTDKYKQKPSFSRHRRRVQGQNPQRTKRRSIERPAKPSPDGMFLPPLSSSGIGRDSSGKKPQRVRKRTCQEDTSTHPIDPSGITGFALNSSGRFENVPNKNPDRDCDEEHKSQWKAPPDLGDDPGLIQHLRRDIIEDSPSIGWKDVVGLEDAKQLLKEAIVMPRLYPQLFSGIRAPWQSCLLYGLPGTGKTLLAKAVATESKATFFNVSASSIVSKYRGESEKLIRTLFGLARHYAPSIIFMDEIDSLMSHRGGGGSGFAGDSSEHEGSRRMKTEMLTQMDGLNSNNRDVFMLAATNLPWDLDTSFLRRMEKQIRVGMPNTEARKAMIRAHLVEFSPLFGKDEVLSRCASAADGLSGSDIRLVCKEAAMRPVRRMLNQLQALGHGEQSLSLILKQNPVTLQDFSDARHSMQPTINSRLASQIDAWGGLPKGTPMTS